MYAPVVQWIKQLRPKEKLAVRVRSGAPTLFAVLVDIVEKYSGLTLQTIPDTIRIWQK